MSKLKNIGCLMIASTMSLLSSCTLEEHFREKVVEVEYPFQLEIPTFTTEDMNMGIEQYPQCHIYAFGEGNSLLKSYEYINYDDNGYFTVPLDMRTRNLYMLLNEEPFILHEEGFEESSILNSVHVSSENSEPDVFMSGVKELSVILPDGETDQFPVVYGLARIDVDVNPGDDKSLVVKSMKISGCPDRTFIFPKEDGSIPENSISMTYKKAFLPFLQKGELKKGAYFVYENGPVPVTITMYCIYDGVEVTVDVPVETLKRNYVYTVKLTDIGQNIIGTVLVEEWLDSDDEITVRPTK